MSLIEIAQREKKRHRKPDPEPRINADELFTVRRGEQSAGGLKLVEPSRLKVQAQARKSFPEEEMANLRESIHESRQAGMGVAGTGILQPLLVRADPSDMSSEASYVLVAGERRLRAAQMLELEYVPCLVVEGNERAIKLTQLIENLQRQDLPPLEEAAAIQELKEAQSLSVRDLAQMLGKGKGYIEDRLRLLKMDEDVRSMVSGRPDTLTHAREIQGVQDPQMRKRLIDQATAGAPLAEIRREITRRTETGRIEVLPKQEEQPAEQPKQELQQEARQELPAAPVETARQRGQRQIEALFQARLDMDAYLSAAAQGAPLQEQDEEIERALEAVAMRVRQAQEASKERPKLQIA